MSFEESVMQLIINGGSAKSGYINAIDLAKAGKMDEIQSVLDEANTMFENAHKVHFQMLSSEAKPESAMENMLLIHAEDQLNSAEIFKVIADEMIDMYKAQLINKASE